MVRPEITAPTRAARASKTRTLGPLSLNPPSTSLGVFVLSHRPAPKISDEQTLVTTGIEDAIAAARVAAGGKDVALMGGGVVASALQAGLVDELILHQVPILLGAGHRFFPDLPAHVELSLVEAVAAPGGTHLHYEVAR